MTQLLNDNPSGAPTLILAHGAGAPMDSDFMGNMAHRIAGHGLKVVRFEFPYMAARRNTQKRATPPRAEKLVDAYRAVVEEVGGGPHVLIGGKSLGGRVASMVADGLHAEEMIGGLVCLGYPFHPPARPDSLRTAHLEVLTCPALIVQGERDPFGTRADVTGYALSPVIEIAWMPDGDHDLKPRKASGHTADGNREEAAASVAAFALRISG